MRLIFIMFFQNHFEMVLINKICLPFDTRAFRQDGNQASVEAVPAPSGGALNGATIRSGRPKTRQEMSHLNFTQSQI